MAHHSEQPTIRDFICQCRELEAQQLKLGATGRTPLGQVSDDDQGEIQMGVSHDSARLKVYLNFGKPVAWIGFTPEQAAELGETILKHSREVRGITV